MYIIYIYYLTFNRLQEITEVAETLKVLPRLTHRRLCCENHPGMSLRGSIFTFSDCLNFKIKHFLHFSKSKYEFLWCTLSCSIFVYHGCRCFTVFVLCEHSRICDFCSWIQLTLFLVFFTYGHSCFLYFLIYKHCSFSVFVVHGHHCCSWLLVYTDTVRSLLFVSYIQCSHCWGGGGVV